MRIDAITLRHIDMPFRAPFKTSRWTQRSKEAVIVEVHADGLSGWGECVALTFPDYCYECTALNWLVLEKFVVPTILGLEFETVEDVLSAISHITGHNMAKAGLETAIWDLIGQRDGLSLQKMLGGGGDRVAVGVSVGVHERPAQLLETVDGYLADGYRRVKIKIKPGHDVEHIALVRRHHPELMLQADGNSVYRLEDAATLRELDQFGLLLIEQPLNDDDVVDHAKLQAQLATAVCLDESILSVRHARWASELKSCRVINIKPGRVGGLTEAKRIHDFCRGEGMPVWMGGMYETGIGRATNVAVASLPGFTLPGDISASAKYFFEDIVERPFELNADSTLSVPTGPGLGVKVDIKTLDKVTLRKEALA
ncbi:MAG TPA: o-succinylbenzoate synthase [Trinickia sp.]|nr:o-succinylbenzoate synthase [Trinickia sp.]